MKRLRDDKEHQIAVDAVVKLWTAETECPNLSSLSAGCLESCRELLTFGVDTAVLPPMPERRRPRGNDDYTASERQLLSGAADALRQVEQLEGVPIRSRDSFGDHAELIEGRLREQEEDAAASEPTTSSATSTPRVSGTKSRGRRLLRGGGS